VLLLLRQRGVAAGSGLGTGLGTTSKYVRRTASNAAGNGLGTTIKYLRRTRNCFVGNGLGTSIKYLRRTTSGVAGNSLSRCQGLLMCPFTASALHSPCLVRASFPNKQNSTVEGWGLGAKCLSVEPGLPPCVHKQIHTNIRYLFLRRLKIIFQYFKKTDQSLPAEPTPERASGTPSAPLEPTQRLNP
jgi:hypothetical protein